MCFFVKCAIRLQSTIFQVKVWFIVFIGLCSLFYGVESLTASLYGASHVALPLQEAKMSTNIRMKIRTSFPNAFILLASGRTDYCFLKLESGRVVFIYKINQSQIQLSSPKNVKLNDLLWHDIAIQRYESNLTMQVDDFFIRKTLSTNTKELNIHFGIFLGSAGDFSENYLHSIPSFRGCLSDVYFNNINILKRAKERAGHTLSVSVKWICDLEFEATTNESITFFDQDSYMLIPGHFNTKKSESFSFDIKSIDSSGIIFYNGFILIEVFNRKLNFWIGKSGNTQILTSTKNISDGHWHSIQVHYNPIEVQIAIDGELNSTKLAQQENSSPLEPFNIFGNFFMTNQTKLSPGFSDRSKTLQGCLRNIYFNGQDVGFPQAQVTSKIAVGCIWRYPCLEKKPCINSGNCRQHGTEDFICSCDQAFCLRAEFAEPYKIFSHESSDDIYEVLSLSPLQLLEGDSIFLTSSYIHVLIDLLWYNISESDVVFHLVQPAKYGQLIYTKPNENISYTGKFFNLVDLNTDRIKYQHDGSEHFNDHMAFDLQLTGITRKTPIYLHGKHRFLLHANILPVNDAPIIKTSGKRILRVTQGIPKLVGPDILTTLDPDSPTTALVYTVSTTDVIRNFGRFEVNGEKTFSFTQAHVNQGAVIFISDVPLNDITSIEMVLHVSDGIETSDAVYFPISIHPLQLRVVNNTGLIMIHMSSALITPWNLSVESNSDESPINIHYKIIEQPQSGSIQKYRSIDSTWVPVDSFTSSEIMLSQIRFEHHLDHPQQDEFKFTATYGLVTTHLYNFRITYTKLKIGITKENDLHFNTTKEAVITSNNLFFQTSPLTTLPRNLIYKVLKAPKYGQLYKNYPPKVVDTFTQFEIDEATIFYKTYRRSFTKFIDTFEFSVFTLKCDTVYGKLNIIYNPDEEQARNITYHRKDTLNTEEGGCSALTKMQFDILFNTYSNLTFIATEPPKFGFLCTHESFSKRTISILQFSLAKLFLGDIFYCHDDTESRNDFMHFLILSDTKADFQFICKVEINILLLNDNAPVRSKNNTFFVVKNSTRVLTSNFLEFIDEDLDSSSTDIIYKNIISTSGIFYKNNKKIEKFTQYDINNNKIIFQHQGDRISKVSFVVTDGVFETNGYLQINASEPFIAVPYSNMTIVQENKFLIFKDIDFPLQTNLNIKPEDIIYDVIDSPSFGVLKMITNSSNTTIQELPRLISVNRFNRVFIKEQKILYWNTGSTSIDSIRYNVSYENISTVGETKIRVYAAAYWEPLQIKNNKTINVEESASVVISRNELEIVHSKTLPSDITYIISTPPQHGYVEAESGLVDECHINKVFDQSAINANRILYIQSGLNQTSDYFKVDVTNGVTWLKDLIIKFIIIPEELYFDVSPLEVYEGKTTQITSTHIRPSSIYYRGKPTEYKILKQPLFGSITAKKLKINRFTQRQLDSGVIFYTHDDSENFIDSFTLIGIVENKKSKQFLIKIRITPINDEPPEIKTNHHQLQLWSGEHYQLKSSDLNAKDLDSLPGSLFYYISRVKGGFLAKSGSIDAVVNEFTQQQIDEGKIYFIHNGETEKNEIIFTLSDGYFNTTEKTLLITTKPVKIFIIHNEKLKIFPSTRTKITTKHLLYKCSDEGRTTEYHISSPPQYGRISHKSQNHSEFKTVTFFTQDEINDGRIYYEHRNHKKKLQTQDLMIFEVGAQKAPYLFDQTFHIEISISSGGLQKYIEITEILVDEGGLVPIQIDFSNALHYIKNNTDITKPNLYIKPSLPQHGWLEMTGGKKNILNLTPDDFILQKVFYVHDHSDTTKDQIIFSIFLLEGNVFLLNLSIPIIINPINDQPFILKTSSPEITVVEGEQKIITRNELNIEDPDTNDEDIIFEIISGPAIGKLIKITENGNPIDLINENNQFSQADINNNCLIYTHSGPSQATLFYFKVSDGKFKPVYEIFNIKILTAFLNMRANNSTIFIKQGVKDAGLRIEHFDISTNIDLDRLLYNITVIPLGGIILNNQEQITTFTHNDLKSNNIIYRQTDMDKFCDSFKVKVYVKTTNLEEFIDIQLVVEPLVKINKIFVTYGSKHNLTEVDSHDFSILTRLNKYNPKITIIKYPTKGFLKKIVRNSGVSELFNEKDITSFSYKELKSGIIYFVPQEMRINDRKVIDSFDYIVTLKSAQPAKGTALIEIGLPKTILEKIGTDDNLFPVHIPTFPINYIASAAVIVGLMIFIFVIIIILKLIYKKVHNNKMAIKAPPSLPCPPDFTIKNQREESYECDSLNATTTALYVSNVPHCKIIPIGQEIDIHDSNNSDDVTENLLGHRLPINRCMDSIETESEDWNISCDKKKETNYSTLQNSNNPLLRRNQYWV